MNYGYTPTPFDDQLESHLTAMLNDFPAPNGKKSLKAYVERDTLYAGVRIRRITDYTPEQRAQIVKCADQIYNELEQSYKKKALASK